MNILLNNFNNILTGVTAELAKRGHTMLPFDGKEETWQKADVIVLWNETALAGWRDWIWKVKSAGKRTVLVQHGRRGTSRIYPPFNETLISDVVCVWSENDRNRLMSVGVPAEKIRVTGTPIWGYLRQRIPHKGTNVVFSPEHWDIDVAENFIVADELRKLKKVNVITKILKNHQHPAVYDNPIESDRNSPDHFSIVADVLAKADLVVAISESTFELLAQSLDIPVVVADCWIPKACDGDERYKEYHREYSNACTMAKLPDLVSTINKQLKRPETLREERRKIVIDDGGKDIADPLMNIINVIESNVL